MASPRTTAEIITIDRQITALKAEEQRAKEQLAASQAVQRENMLALSANVTRRISRQPSNSMVGDHNRGPQRRMSYRARKQSVPDDGAQSGELEVLKRKLIELEQQVTMREQTWQELLKRKGDQLLLVMRREETVIGRLRGRLTELEERNQELETKVAVYTGQEPPTASASNNTSRTTAAQQMLGHQRVMEVQKSQQDLLAAFQRAVQGTAAASGDTADASPGDRSPRAAAGRGPRAAPSAGGAARGGGGGGRGGGGARAGGGGASSRQVSAVGGGGAADDGLGCEDDEYLYNEELQEATAALAKRKELCDKLFMGCTQMAQLARQQAARVRAALTHLKQAMADEFEEIREGLGARSGVPYRAPRLRNVASQAGMTGEELDMLEQESQSSTQHDPKRDAKRAEPRAGPMRLLLKKVEDTLAPQLAGIRAAVGEVTRAVPRAQVVSALDEPLPGLGDVFKRSGDDAHALYKAGAEFLMAISEGLQQQRAQLRQVAQSAAPHRERERGRDPAGTASEPVTPVVSGTPMLDHEHRNSSASTADGSAEPPVSHKRFKAMVQWIKAQVRAATAEPDADDSPGAAARRQRLEQALEWAQQLIREGEKAPGVARFGDEGRAKQGGRQHTTGASPSAPGAQRALQRRKPGGGRESPAVRSLAAAHSLSESSVHTQGVGEREVSDAEPSDTAGSSAKRPPNRSTKPPDSAPPRAGAGDAGGQPRPAEPAPADSSGRRGAPKDGAGGGGDGARGGGGAPPREGGQGDPGRTDTSGAGDVSGGAHHGEEVAGDRQVALRRHLSDGAAGAAGWRQGGNPGSTPDGGVCPQPADYAAVSDVMNSTGGSHAVSWRMGAPGGSETVHSAGGKGSPQTGPASGQEKLQVKRLDQRRLSEAGVFCILCGTGPHYFTHDGDNCPDCGATLQAGVARRLHYLRKRTEKVGLTGAIGIDARNSASVYPTVLSIGDQRIECLRQVLWDFNVWAQERAQRAAGAAMPPPPPPWASAPCSVQFTRRGLAAEEVGDIYDLCRAALFRGRQPPSQPPALFLPQMRTMPPEAAGNLHNPIRPPTNQVTRMLRDYCSAGGEAGVLPPLVPAPPPGSGRGAPAHRDPAPPSYLGWRAHPPRRAAGKTSPRAAAGPQGASPRADSTLQAAFLPEL